MQHRNDRAIGGGRRRWLRAAGGAVALGALGGLGVGRGWAAGPLRPVKLAWNANAICLAAAPVALERGIFEKHGLKVELVNFAGSTDQLLESIATAKADAGVGMIHRWIKPLESGFDVKLVGSSHGGCSRLVGYAPAGVTDLKHLKGRTIAVSDLNAPGKNFFSVLLAKAGIDPEREVAWRQFPGDMLGLAVEKGEAQAIADGDPNLLLIQRRTQGLVDLATNLTGEYAAKTCCVLGVGGALVRNDRATAAALTRDGAHLQPVFQGAAVGAARRAGHAHAPQPPRGPRAARGDRVLRARLQAREGAQSQHRPRALRRARVRGRAVMSAVADHLLAPPPALRQAQARAPVWWTGALAALAWALLAALTHLWPNKPAGFTEWACTAEFAAGAAAVALLLAALALAPRPLAALRERLRPAGPWLVALAAGLALWEVLTAKLGVLPPPFFAPPQALVEVYAGDAPRLAESAGNSLRLLAIGIAIGAAAGFATGVLIGWSRAANYWVHPVLRILGPVPTTALLPVCFYFFPSSWSTAVFLIALGMAFPVAILTWSGVAGVHKNYYDVARTMGASQWFLVLRVAIPAALPQVFVGLFMGLGAAFSTLVVAEMLGVKSGLGWYLTWAQGWAAYPNMYAALILMALLFSGVITLLFAVRDRVLSWQKGVVKW